MKDLKLKVNELPKGDYVISDPCYVLSDENYNNLIYSKTELDENGNKKVEPMEGVGELNGIPMFNHGTCWGDGLYTDDENHEYGVDSGQIGCIPMELVDKDNLNKVDGEKERKDGSTFSLIRKIHFPQNFECTYENGVFFIGDVIIETK
jgi:hypothetical protein